MVDLVGHGNPFPTVFLSELYEAAFQRPNEGSSTRIMPTILGSCGSEYTMVVSNYQQICSRRITAEVEAFPDAKWNLSSVCVRFCLSVYVKNISCPRGIDYLKQYIWLNYHLILIIKEQMKFGNTFPTSSFIISFLWFHVICLPMTFSIG